MIASIHQPSYFPWLGLLYKINSSDTFIVLDNVQLSDSAYQNRNIFLTNSGQIKYLTIPFIKKDYMYKGFKDLEIADFSWKKNHLNFLLNNYKKHPFFDEIYPYIEKFMSQHYHFLLDAVMESMHLSFELFGIQTNILFQSELNYNNQAKKGELVIELLKAINAEAYFSGKGAESYQNDSMFELEKINLQYINFQHPLYCQKNAIDFNMGLSCLDVLFNLGTKNSRSILTKEMK